MHHILLHFETNQSYLHLWEFGICDVWFHIINRCTLATYPDSFITTRVFPLPAADTIMPPSCTPKFIPLIMFVITYYRVPLATFIEFYQSVRV